MQQLLTKPPQLPLKMITYQNIKSPTFSQHCSAKFTKWFREIPLRLKVLFLLIKDIPHARTHRFVSLTARLNVVFAVVNFAGRQDRVAHDAGRRDADCAGEVDGLARAAPVPAERFA